MLALLPFIQLDFLDASGSIARTQIRLKQGTTIASAETAALAIRGVIEPMTDAIIVRQDIRYEMVPATLAAVTGNTPITECGVFVFVNIGSGSKALVSVPAMSPFYTSNLGDGANLLLDMLNGDILDFVSEIIGSIATTPFGADVNDLVIAYRQERV